MQEKAKIIAFSLILPRFWGFGGKLLREFRVISMKRNALILIIFILPLSCKSPREVVRVEHDSIYITHHLRDSIHTNDSVRIIIGDTITVEHWRTKYVQRWRIDTLTEHHTDTITRVEVREVEKPLSWWQRKRLQWFPALLGILALLLVWTFRSPILKLLKL